MSIARPHDPSETLEFGRSMAPRIGTRAWLGATALVLAAGASGAYAYVVHNDREQVQSALASSEESLRGERAKAKHFEAQLGELRQASATQRAQLTDLGKKLDEANAELVSANISMVELVDERGELGAELAEFKQMSRELSQMIDSGRLQVSFRRGRMVVELKAQVLFPSGSADLTADGKDALKEVAKSLRGFKGRHFIVAGHTDNKPVSGPFENNWALSSARALNVTGALIRAGLRPQQLVAAGYGEYDPIARNTTDAGRQSNRRIEIILEPRLKDVKSNTAEK